MDQLPDCSEKRRKRLLLIHDYHLMTIVLVLCRLMRLPLISSYRADNANTAFQKRIPNIQFPQIQVCDLWNRKEEISLYTKCQKPERTEPSILFLNKL